MKNKVYAAINGLFFVAVAILAALYIVYDTVPVKAVASGIFVFGGIANLVYVLRCGKGGYPLCKWLMVAGQIITFIGDIAICYNLIAGMAVFAIGHILFIAAFCTINCVGWRDILPAVIVFVAGILFFVFYPFNFNGMLPYVIIYALIISCMLGKACGVAFDRTVYKPLRISVVCGAVTFVISDLFLAMHRFAGFGRAYVVLCLVFYYIAQYLLSVTAGISDLSGEKRLKPQMNIVKRLFCRAYQFVFKIIIPVLPYRQPKPIENCAKAAELLKEKGKKRALIVTDKGICACGLTKPVENALKEGGIEYSIYSDTVVNPTNKNAEEAAAMFNADGCDCLIAIGGGSAMDCAKAAGARIIKPKKSFAKMKGVLKVFGKLPLFIAVPTTAGTGSETTIAAVITDGDTRDKYTIISFCLAPHYALLDPEMTVGLPKHMTSTTGMDALTHAVEAYIGGSTTKLTRKLSVEAVSIIKDNLLKAYNDGTDRVARERMQYAAYCAGLAFTISYVGYVHAVAHSLGGKYNTPHGLANAVILPYVLKRYGKSAEKRLARLARESGVALKDDTDKEASAKFIQFVEDMNRAMDIPDKLRVEEGDIPELAAHADKEANPLYPVPVLMNKKALKAIYYDIREVNNNERSNDMREILDEQKLYFASGATLPIDCRIDALERLRDAIYENEDKINEALKADLGKSPSESYICETGMTLSEISYLIKHVEKWAQDEKVHTPLAQFASKSYIKKSPYGCTLIMSPWNYPFMLTVEPLADAIAAGNTAIVKPSAYSPATSQVLADIIGKTFDEKFVAVVQGGRAENSQLLDMDFDKIFFTGSVAVGKEVMRKAAERLIPVTLELGGKSPCIVDETAKISLAAKRIAFGKFLNCGQTCVAPDYVLVHESVKDKFLKALQKAITSQYGKEPLKNQNYGKIISEKHYNRIKGLIDKEKIYCGGECDDTQLRIAPTVMAGCDWNDAAMGEEIFGPVLPVISYTNLDEVIAKINSGWTPLALYLFTSDKFIVQKVTNRVAFGGGCINDTVIHLATSEMGFGGCGESGMGSYHGKKGFDCFTHEKSIVDKKTFIDMPMRYQPYSKFKDKLIRKFMK